MIHSPLSYLFQITNLSPFFTGRQPKTVELIQAEPLFRDLPNFQPPKDEPIRCSSYIGSGKGFIYTTPNDIKVIDTITGLIILKIEIPDIFEISVSPLGNYITTWSKLTKNPENDKTYIKNVNLIKIDLSNNEKPNFKIIHSMLNTNQNGWIPQFNYNESIICFKRNPYSLNFFKFDESIDNFEFSKPSTLDLKEFGKIEEFKISPGLNSSVSVFILPINNGNPSFIKIYSLLNLKSPISSKQFFKGESCIFNWNSIGTSLLALISTDVDSTNKSYYGETQLYLLDINGLLVQKIDLPNDGPIHECTWSPTSREFAVIYGFMPAITTFFDSRGNILHSLPKSSRNSICYSPHAKFILVAGFGNLPGDVDILDRQNKFNKIASFQASNTSVCKWSPDGRFILTATTSPRLRVDNSIKIWYFNGSLVYFKEFTELNSVDWRFQPLIDFPPINNSKIDKLDCEPHSSALKYLEKQNSKLKTTSTTKSGAYRPPHARNTNTTTTSSNTGRSLADLAEQKQNGYTSRSNIPGLTTTTSSSSTIASTTTTFAQLQLQQQNNSESKSAQKNRKKRQNKKSELGASSSSPAPSTNSIDSADESSLVIGGVVSLEEKKIRNLLKKLRAIEALKIKQENMEHLEDTQLLKISTEPAVRKELESLGWKE